MLITYYISRFLIEKALKLKILIHDFITLFNLLLNYVEL